MHLINNSMLIIIGNKKKLNIREKLYKRSKYLTIWKTLKKSDNMRLFNKNDSLNSKKELNKCNQLLTLPKMKNRTKTPIRRISIRPQGQSTPKTKRKTPIRKISKSNRIQGYLSLKKKEIQ